MKGALISGAAGVAVIREGREMWCVRSQSPTPRAISPGMVPFLFGDTSEGTYHPEVTKESAGRFLETACRQERAVQLALLSIDPTSSAATRELAEDALEEFLDDEQVAEFVENRLFSNPMPETARWVEDRASAFQAFPKLSRMRDSVTCAQRAIRLVRAAWDGLPEKLFAEPDDRMALESALIRFGAFRVLATAIDDHADRFRKGNAQLSILADRRYGEFRNSRGILVEWIRRIPGAGEAVVDLPVRPDVEENNRGNRRRKRPDLSPSQEAFENVIAQKEAILDQLSRRNFRLAEKFVDDLVRSQVSHDRGDLAAKSLCDLAKRAKDLGFSEYHLAWSGRAREIQPGDPYVHTQYADALLSRGDFTEALSAYEDTLRDFSENVVARNGKAEVLKALGRLPEALSAYEDTVRDFPENVVARAGSADVLKALGRLTEALSVYEDTIRDFPENVVARNGKAEVLKALGRLPEALSAYEDTIRDFPENVVARNGKAEVLRALGRLPEALSAYEDTICDFREDVVARNGKAEVLKALGRLPEALSAYEGTIRDFPENVVARAGRAEVLKALGRLPEALSVYEGTIRDFPEDVVARNGKAEVLKALGRLTEALSAYEGTIRDFPENVVARSGKAEVLKALGRLPEALSAYEGTIRDFPENVIARNGQATVLLQLGHLSEAAALVRIDRPQSRDQWIAFHLRATIELKCGRIAEADRLFSAGLQCPWADVRPRFVASRALLRIQTKRLREADEMIRSEQTLEAKVIRIDIYRRMKRAGDAKPLLRELEGCHVARIVEISRQLEENMTGRKRTVSDDEFLEREIALLLAA